MPRKKQRENYGNGSVTPVMVTKDGKRVQERDKQGRPIWRICITIGTEEYVDEKGRKHKRQIKAPQKRYHGTLEEARRLAKQLSDGYENIDITAAKMTFADACTIWADSMRENATCAQSKLKDYVTRLDYVSEHLGSKPLIEITTDDLERALSAVKAERNQSQRTYRDCKRHVKRVFKFALQKHWIVFDVSEGLATVSVRGRVERRSLEADQFARLRLCVDRDIVAAMRDFQHKEARQATWGKMFTRSSIKGLANISCLVGIRLLLSTGMRRGEMLALTWDRVDFDSGSITIDRALNADAILKEPKTNAGTRRIAIDADTIQLLKQWKEFQARILHLVMEKGPDGKRHSVGQSEGTPVVCNCVGGWLDPHNMNRWWGGNNDTEGYRDTIGFSTLKLHELRHTAATLLLGNGMPVVDVAARLGHSDVSVTLNTYGHAIPAHDRAAADLIGSLMAVPAGSESTVIELEKRSA